MPQGQQVITSKPVSDLLVNISKGRVHREAGGVENFPPGNALPGCPCEPVFGETYGTNAETVL